MAAYETGPMSKPSVMNNTQRVTNFATDTATKDKSVGYLDVFVHQARDIHNVCIYHKQDVYAKLSLTSDPAVSCSTKVINGGGQNPVFDERLRLDVRSVDTSLRCEIWMLSRIKNYLEDQLLGFALVPLADILMADGKLVQEFSMSSTDLFHSPAGFVHLSLSYVGCCPDVIEISSPNKSASVVTDSGNDRLVPSALEKVEFPDLNIANENHIMVSKYIEMEILNNENPVKSENGELQQCNAAMPETETCGKKLEEHRGESPLSCISTADNFVGLSATAQSVSEPSEATAAASSTESQKEKNQDIADGEADSSQATPGDEEVVKPMISINLQPGESVVQQDFVDMYMKSMQQFTDSLAKMKLPLDFDNGSPSPDSTNSSTTEKPSPSKGSKVFYGSRAFF